MPRFPALSISDDAPPGRVPGARWYLPVVIQAAVALAAMLALEFWPPATGRMLLLPVWNASIGKTYALALDGGAAVIGRGPFAGSLVVTGERARLLATTSGTPVLVLAAVPAGCDALADEAAV